MRDNLVMKTISSDFTNQFTITLGNIIIPM